MVAVTWSVQIDFSATAFGGSPTWTDVTSYAWGAQPILLGYGGQDETGVQPRTCSLLLDNGDGRFTPDYASSPYAHSLDLGMRLRVSCVVGGVTFYRFDGFITSVEASFVGGGPMSQVAVTAQDTMGQLGNDTTPLYSLLTETILYDGPSVYLPLTDDAGSTTATLLAASVATGTPSIVSSKYGAGTVAFAGGSGPTAEGGQALLLTQPSSTVGSVISTPVNVRLSFTPQVSIRVNWSGTATGGTLMSLSSSAGKMTIELDGSGHAKATILGNVLTTTAVINDGKPHDIAANLGAGILSLYVDGGLISTLGSLSGLPPPGFIFRLTTLCVGGLIDGSITAGLTSGTYSHAAVYGSVSPSWADQYNAGANGLAGELTSARFTRLLGYRTNTGSTVATGQSTAGNQSTAGLSLAEALKQVGDTEGTPVVTDGQGNIVFLSRASLYTPPTTLTLDASLQQISADIRFRKDTQVIVNDVTVDRYQASSHRITDATSKNTYGPRQRSITTVSYTDRDALDNAGWAVAAGKTSKVRMPSITVDLLTETSTTVAQNVLSATILGTVTATNLPAVGSPATSVTSVIQGWQEQISPDVWTVSFFTAPTAPNTLYADATNTSRNLLDSGLVVAW